MVLLALAIAMFILKFNLILAAATLIYVAAIAFIAEYLHSKKSVSEGMMFALILLAAGVYLVMYMLLRPLSVAVYLPVAVVGWYVVADAITTVRSVGRHVRRYVERA